MPLIWMLNNFKAESLRTFRLFRYRLSTLVLNAYVTNHDMSKIYDDYQVENLQVPTLVFQAKDDKLVNYADTEKAIRRFPNCTFISFESGGHLMEGHGEEIKEAVSKFVKER